MTRIGKQVADLKRISAVEIGGCRRGKCKKLTVYLTVSSTPEFGDGSQQLDVTLTADIGDQSTTETAKASSQSDADVDAIADTGLAKGLADAGKDV